MEPSEPGGSSPVRRPLGREGASTRAGELLRLAAGGEPLDLAACAGRRVRDRAVLVDVDRLARLAGLCLRTRASASQASPTSSGEPCEQRLAACVDAALDAILRADRAAERRGLAPDPGAHALLVSAFGLEPHRARRAAVAFNDLPEGTRKGFFALVIEGRPLARCVADGLGEPVDLRRHARAGLQALGLLP